MTFAVVAVLLAAVGAALGLICIAAWMFRALDRRTWRRLRKRAPYIQD